MPIKQTSNSVIIKIPKAVIRTFNQLELVVNPLDNTTRRPVIKVSDNFIKPTGGSTLAIGKISFRY